MKARAYMSFGGGVQSTAIAMLAVNRDPRLLEASKGVLPELYLFADTGDEPYSLYDHIIDMRHRIQQSGAAFYTVVTPLGSLSEHTLHALRNGHRRAEQMPFFVRCKDGRYGPVQRRCTAHFKLAPLTKRARDWFGVYRGKPHVPGPVQVWLGISTDEPQRLKTGPVPKQAWLHYFNPLYAMGWSRADCLAYLTGQGIRARRSACVFCPCHRNDEWRQVRQHPLDWARALAVDDALQAASADGRKPFGFDSPLFLHYSGKRLREIDWDATEATEINQWDNECGGVCGV